MVNRTRACAGFVGRGGRGNDRTARGVGQGEGDRDDALPAHRRGGDLRHETRAGRGRRYRSERRDVVVGDDAVVVVGPPATVVGRQVSLYVSESFVPPPCRGLQRRPAGPHDALLVRPRQGTETRAGAEHTVALVGSGIAASAACSGARRSAASCWPSRVACRHRTRLTARASARSRRSPAGTDTRRCAARRGRRRRRPRTRRPSPSCRRGTRRPLPTAAARSRCARCRRPERAWRPASRRTPRRRPRATSAAA